MLTTWQREEREGFVIRRVELFCQTLNTISKTIVKLLFNQIYKSLVHRGATSVCKCSCIKRFSIIEIPLHALAYNCTSVHLVGETGIKSILPSPTHRMDRGSYLRVISKKRHTTQLFWRKIRHSTSQFQFEGLKNITNFDAIMYGTICTVFGEPKKSYISDIY